MKNAERIKAQLAEAKYVIGQAERMVDEENPLMLAFAIGGAHGLLMRLAIDELGYLRAFPKGA